MRRRFMNDWFYGRLKGLGCRMTQARDIILEILKKEKHLSAEEIYFKIHKEYPNIGIATVYRTLNFLSNFGILRKREFGDGKARYEFFDEREEDNHHHLICTSCGKIIEYKDFMEEEVNFLRNLEKKLSEKYNFEIKDHLINFYGLCKECNDFIKKGGDKDALW